MKCHEARCVETPLDKRYTFKLASEDARPAAANNAVLAPCVLGYNGGIHMDFDKLLVKFARAPGQHVFEFPDDIRDALHHVHHVINATIVNRHAIEH